MKRFIISFMTFFFSVCIALPITSVALDEEQEGHQYQTIVDIDNKADHIVGKVDEISDKIDGIETGASQESIDELKESVDNIDIEQGFEDFVNKKSEEIAAENEKKQAEENGNEDLEKEESPTTLSDAILDILNKAWGALPGIISASEDDPTWQLTLDPKSQYNGTFYAIFVTIGYSLVLVFFAANLIETTIKYEIFTLKGGAQIFGRLIVSKFIIDVSGKVCIYILNICENICSEITKNVTNTLNMQTPDVFATQLKNTVWPIGPILDFFQGIILIIPVLIIVLIMLIAIIFIMLRLVLRSIELSLLVIVSPAFFACYSSEITKPYFTNFIITFLQCALQIVFMAVVYALSSDWMLKINSASTAEDVWVWFIHLVPNAIIALAIAIMMIRPPRVLTGLVHR